MIRDLLRIQIAIDVLDGFVDRHFRFIHTIGHIDHIAETEQIDDDHETYANTGTRRLILFSSLRSKRDEQSKESFPSSSVRTLGVLLPKLRHETTQKARERTKKSVRAMLE